MAEGRHRAADAQGAEEEVRAGLKGAVQTYLKYLNGEAGVEEMWRAYLGLEEEEAYLLMRVASRVILPERPEGAEEVVKKRVKASIKQG